VRLTEAQHHLDALVQLRENARKKILVDLERYWEQTHTEQALRQAILKAAPGLDAESLHTLQKALEERRYVALLPVMQKVQLELEELWNTLSLPESQHKPFVWKVGQPLSEEQVKSCQGEASRLEDWAAHLQPVLTKVAVGDGEQKGLIGEVLTCLHAGIVKKEQSKLNRAATKSANVLLEDEEDKEAMEDDDDGGGGSGGGSSSEMREQLKEMRRLNEKQLKALQDEHNKQLQSLKDNAEIEKRNRDEILKQQMAQEHRAANYGELLYRLQTKLAQGRDYLDMLGAAEVTVDKFDETHGSVQMKPPLSATDADIKDLGERVVAIEEVVDRLEARTESDGIFCALWSLCDRKGWPHDPTNLMRRVAESGADIRQFALQRSRSYTMGGGIPPISYQQLTEWLHTNQIRYTEDAMAFLLQSMGTSTTECERGDRIETNEWVKAFAENRDAQKGISIAPQLVRVPKPTTRQASQVRPICAECGSEMFAGKTSDDGSWMCASCIGKTF